MPKRWPGTSSGSPRVIRRSEHRLAGRGCRSAGAGKCRGTARTDAGHRGGPGDRMEVLDRVRGCGRRHRFGRIDEAQPSGLVGASGGRCRTGRAPNRSRTVRSVPSAPCWGTWLGTRALAASDGRMPPNGGAWGWLPDRDGRPQPSGKRIGWVRGADVYLEPQAAFAAAQDLAREQGEIIPITPQTLWRRLRDRGLLASREADRQRNTVRLTLDGTRREVVHLRATRWSRPPRRPNRPAASEDASASMLPGTVSGTIRPQPASTVPDAVPRRPRQGRSQMVPGTDGTVCYRGERRGRTQITMAGGTGSDPGPDVARGPALARYRDTNRRRPAAVPAGLSGDPRPS